MRLSTVRTALVELRRTSMLDGAGAVRSEEPLVTGGSVAGSVSSYCAATAAITWPALDTTASPRMALFENLPEKRQ